MVRRQGRVTGAGPAGIGRISGGFGLALVLGLALSLTPSPAAAYVGPGIGLGLLGTLIAVVGAVLVGLFGIILYPISLLRKKLRRRDEAESAELAPATKSD